MSWFSQWLRIRVEYYVLENNARPFVAEPPLHILLYVEGAVQRGWWWCHVSIPLLCSNELYSWWTVTPWVSLWPVLLFHHWAWPSASVLQVEFGELVYGMYTRGEPTRVPLKNETGPLFLRVILGDAKMTPKNQRGTLTLENFRMLNFDEFISNSSYTTKIYMKTSGVRPETL